MQKFTPRAKSATVQNIWTLIKCSKVAEPENYYRNVPFSLGNTRFIIERTNVQKLRQTKESDIIKFATKRQTVDRRINQNHEN